MLTRMELSRLERSLRGTKSLSVYVDGATRNPAERMAWRRGLSDAIDRTRQQLHGAPHDEREAFDAAVERLEERLAADREVAGFRGWAGFVTPHEVRHGEALPVPVPVLVAWGDRIRVAPYIRALEQRAPVVIAVADSRKARVYTMRDGSIERHRTLHAHAHLGPLTHLGHPPRQGFHTGTRGPTGADAMGRAWRAGRERMLRTLADRLAALAGPDGSILVGGIPEVATAALVCLPREARRRARQVAGLDVHATAAQVAARADVEITELREEAAAAAVGEILDRYGAGGTAAVRRDGVLAALRERAVDRLYFSERFLGDEPLAAEEAVQAAFDQDADVTWVDGRAAERLDAQAQGVAARLRFVPTRGQAPLEASPP